MTCGDCQFFVTDEAEGKLLPDWQHSDDESAFCPMKALFTTVCKNDPACEDFYPYKKNLPL